MLHFLFVFALVTVTLSQTSPVLDCRSLFIHQCRLLCFAFDFESITPEGWLSDSNCCNWNDGIVCNDNNLIISVDFSNMGLYGSVNLALLPIEMESLNLG